MRTDIQTLLAVSFIALSAGTNLAAAQEACSTYTIQRGDTLTNISKRAYGNGDFSKIFLANRATIGNNPNLIEVGQQIELPCSRKPQHPRRRPRPPRRSSRQRLPPRHSRQRPR
ncbi:MAG: LysM peptidoglycan-binding domain-containing protein [Rhodobacteraceae bacterium]|nr:LysM peptidoglycan-binding domain-containing protein [Paracoccaceae bacterium]